MAAVPPQAEPVHSATKENFNHIEKQNYKENLLWDSGMLLARLPKAG